MPAAMTFHYRRRLYREHGGQLSIGDTAARRDADAAIEP